MYGKIYRSIRGIALFTMLISLALVFSASYAVLNMNARNEIRAAAALMASGIEAGGEEFISELPEVLEQQGVTEVFVSGGEGVPGELFAAAQSSGAAERDSASGGFEYAVKISGGRTLYINARMGGTLALEILKRLAAPVIFVFFIIYLLITVIAVQLTHNITEPIVNVNLKKEKPDNPYEELEPFFTRIVRQEKEIESQMEALKEQKSRLETISESMSEGLVVLGGAGEVLSVNGSALSAFNTAAGLVLGHNYIRLTRNGSFSMGAAAAVSGKKGMTERHEGGKTYQLFYSPVHQEDGRSGAVLLLIDVSERARAEEMRREFSANVSHELKTPLTTILGYSQMINNGMARQEDIAEFSGKIEREAVRLLTLIEDIIKLSSLDEGDGAAEAAPVNMRALAAEAVQNLKIRAEERGVAISAEGGDCVVNGNATQLAELVFNLADNAVKYNREGGSVVIRTEPGKISVADTGIGIPESDKDRIFERFYRVDKSRSKKVNGTGLGLSIVKHIAICHKATISVESKQGEGTVISVSFEGENGGL